MAVSAGVILALSLIVAGIAILGDAFSLWDLPGDVFGVVVLLLGTAGKYASDRTKAGRREPEAEPPEEPPGSHGPNGPAPPAGPRAGGSMFIILIAPFLWQCGGISSTVAADAKTWAACAGAGAIQCAPAAAAASLEEAAIGWAACLASRAIGCAGLLVQPNPPPPNLYDAIDLRCVTDAASRCLHAAQVGDARACVEEKIAGCASGQVHP